MNTTKSLQQNLNKLVTISNEDCTCNENLISCRRCFAEQELRAINTTIREVLETIETDLKKYE